MSTIGRILEHLKKQGQTNTFRLASELGVDRHNLLKIIEKLEKKQLVEFKSGTVKFLKFPEKEKRVEPIKIIKAYSKPQKAVQKVKKSTHREISSKKLQILKNIRTENEMLKGKLLGLETRIKSQSYYKNKARNQNEQIEQLERKIKAFQQKAKSPKIIRRTIIKNIIKKVPVERIETKPKRFKLPKFNLGWIKNIQRLAKPEFIKQKVNIGMPKINFAELNKNIQQLHVPEVLRKSI